MSDPINTQPTAASEMPDMDGDGDTRGDISFEDMGLKTGTRLQVQLPLRLNGERSFVRLIGHLQGHSLLITSPKNGQGLFPSLYEAETLVMRAFSGQSAFAFASNILRACKLPYNYLHLSFPENIQGAIVRKAPRVKTKISATVRNSRHAGQELAGLISNLSANGALLDAPHSMATEGDRLALAFKLKLHDVENSLTVQAVVRAILDDEKLRQSGSLLTHFGLEFVDLQPSDLMLLKSIVYQKIIEDPQSMT